jgi:simple sugar transport system ATP-binding protein
MIGEDISFKYEKKEVSTGSPILGVNKIRVRSDQGMVAIKDLSFNVHEREIFGIAGVSGNGQKELVEAITGLRKVEKGTINIDNQNVINLSPKLINKLGVSHIPEERMRYGVVPNLLIFENTILNKYYKKPFSKFSFLSYSFIREYTYKIANKFQVNTPSINIPVKSLSGGNIQKLIFGREISEKAKLIIASHPTYGLDINATRYIRELLIQKREEGSAILLLSEDLDEILELSDKSAVIFEGEFMGIMNPKDIGIGDIGLMMAGSKRILNNESVIQN